MAMIQNTAFETKVTNRVFDEPANITGLFKNGSGNDEILFAGALCVRDELLPNEGYEAADVLNNNTWSMVLATSDDTANTPIYACNTYNVNELTDPVTGNTYKVGSNTLGLPAPAGVLTTYTRIHFAPGDRHYRFGIGNLTTELGENKFFTINNGQLVPTGSAPAAGTPYFKLLGTGNFVAGAYNSFGYVDVEAHIA